MATAANPYLYRDELTRVVRAAAADPLQRPRFAFVALHDVHQPVEAPEALVSLYPAASYNASTEPRRVYNAMHNPDESQTATRLDPFSSVRVNVGWSEAVGFLVRGEISLNLDLSSRISILRETLL